MPRAFAIVMAGGSGTRFWPLSRADLPKQLLPLAGGDESLLQASVRRVAQVVAQEDILVVTSERLAAATRAQLDLPAENIMAEPTGRNTAPCVGWAATRVAREDPEAICVVLPADHHITDENEYAAILGVAIDAATRNDIVTVGIRPSRPETGYGYVEMGIEIADGVHKARRFVEKPNRQRAEQFLASGTFLWNSGMFFFRARTMLEAIREHLPGLGATLDSYLAVDLSAEAALVASSYGSLPSVSIDHGVMEKVTDVSLVPADFGWSDLGSFASAWELAERDDAGNVAGGAITIDAEGCFVQAPEGKLVALLGVRDLVIIDTPEALLVVPRERAQEVKAIVEQLKERGDERL